MQVWEASFQRIETIALVYYLFALPQRATGNEYSRPPEQAIASLQPLDATLETRESRFFIEI